MAKIDGPKYAGSLVVDLTPVKDILVDLPPGTLKGARAEQEGIDGVLEELATSMPNHGAEIEISPAVYERVISSTADIKTLRGCLMGLGKLMEIARETLGKLENNREDDLSTIGKSAEDRAEKQKNPALLAHFERTIRYKGQVADKAHATRRKNEEAKAEAANEATPATPGSDEGKPPVT